MKKEGEKETVHFSPEVFDRLGDFSFILALESDDPSVEDIKKFLREVYNQSLEIPLVNDERWVIPREVTIEGDGCVKFRRIPGYNKNFSYGVDDELNEVVATKRMVIEFYENKQENTNRPVFDCPIKSFQGSRSLIFEESYVDYYGEKSVLRRRVILKSSRNNHLIEIGFITKDDKPYIKFGGD